MAGEVTTTIRAEPTPAFVAVAAVGGRGPSGRSGADMVVARSRCGSVSMTSCLLTMGRGLDAPSS